MFLFGFSVLAVLLCGDVFSRAIRTSDADHEQEDFEKYGIYSSYCQKSRNNSYSFPYVGQLNYPPTPIECCNQPEMRCKNYINPGETKFGLRNTDDSWPIRECICERKLWECLRKVLTPDDASRAKGVLYPERCFEMTKCKRKSTLGCTPEYKEITVYHSELMDFNNLLEAIIMEHTREKSDGK